MKLKALLESSLKKKFWEDVDKSLLKEIAGSSKLESLLKQADSLVFNPLNIDTTSKEYFVAGSARLYLYPKLRELLDLPEITDLDLVMPGDSWNDLESKFGNKKGFDSAKRRYEPAPDIEIFDKWKPGAAVPDETKDTSVRDSETILKESTVEYNYRFMPLYDVMDYKLQLNREKEQKVTLLVYQYAKAQSEDEKKNITDKVLNVFQGDKKNADDFLNPTLVSKVKK